MYVLTYSSTASQLHSPKSCDEVPILFPYFTRLTSAKKQARLYRRRTTTTTLYIVVSLFRLIGTAYERGRYYYYACSMYNRAKNKTHSPKTTFLHFRQVVAVAVAGGMNIPFVHRLPSYTFLCLSFFSLPPPSLSIWFYCFILSRVVAKISWIFKQLRAIVAATAAAAATGLPPMAYWVVPSSSSAIPFYVVGIAAQPTRGKYID